MRADIHRASTVFLLLANYLSSNPRVQAAARAHSSEAAGTGLGIEQHTRKYKNAIPFVSQIPDARSPERKDFRFRLTCFVKSIGSRCK